MISALKRLAKAGNSLQKGMEFNGRLPVGIEVLQKKSPQSYLLRVGTKEFMTKSTQALHVGDRYWAILQEAQGQSAAIALRHLIKKPSLFQERVYTLLPTYTLEEFERLLFDSLMRSTIHQSLLQKLALTQSREDFLLLINLLEALERGTLILALKYENKRTILQISKRKSQSQPSREDGIIGFYAGFENLGPVEGVVYVKDGQQRVQLFVNYEESLHFLQSRNSLKEVHVEFRYKKEAISPFYEPVASLLDLKG